MSTKIKCNIYRILIRPVLTYGSECWSITKAGEKTLLRFERKILRGIYGPVCENGEWKRRYNHELQEISNEVDVIFISISKLRWLGHVYRRPDDESVMQILTGNPEGNKRRGRPRVRWLDDVEGILRQLQISGDRRRGIGTAGDLGASLDLPRVVVLMIMMIR